MSRTRAIAIADRAAPLALKLIAGANLLFLGAFLATLIVAAETGSVLDFQHKSFSAWLRDCGGSAAPVSGMSQWRVAASPESRS